MRKDWLAPTAIPPSGGFDEFDRKLARNDYPIMALLEMGVRQLRIPQTDLTVKRHRQRLKALTHQGFEFTLFSCGVPDKELIDLISRHGSLIRAWEIAAPLDRVTDLVDALSVLDTGSRPLIYFSKLQTREDVEPADDGYWHVVHHGFSVTGDPAIESLSTHPGVQKLLAGWIFRVGCDQDIGRAIQLAHDTAQLSGKLASVHVRMGNENPAEPRWDETWVANRVAGALAMSHAYPTTGVFIDTLADVDRGYFPRVGVLDAFHNPRLGFHVIRNLNAKLSQNSAECAISAAEITEDGEFLSLVVAGERACLVLPKKSSDNLVVPARVLPTTVGGTLEILDPGEGLGTRVKLQSSTRNGLWLRTDGTPIFLSVATD